MRITVDGDLVGIDVRLSDPVVAGLLGVVEGEERMNRFADMVEVGARVLQRQQDGQQGELLRREVERMQEAVDRSRQELIDRAGADFAQAVTQVITRVSEQLASIGGRLDGALAVADRSRELADERDRGTAKGRVFEEEVAAAIQSISVHRGDVCEHVGDVADVGAKVGDVLVELDGASGTSRGRVVFECKTGRLSKPEAMRELDRALVARDADFAVLVVPHSQKTPAQTRLLSEYGGNKMIVVYEPDDGLGLAPATPIALEVGYALARARVLMSRSDAVETVDVEGARMAIEQAVQQFDRVRSIKLKLTSIASTAEETKSLVDDLVGVLRSILDRVSESLRQA